jgi:hypothetical protein
MILRATISTLARCLGVRDDQAESVLQSEASARAALSRRGLFRAAGAVAAGVAFGDVVVPAESRVAGECIEIVFACGPAPGADSAEWWPDHNALASLLSRDAIVKALIGERGAIVLPPGLRMRHVPEPSAALLTELFEDSP